MTSRGKSFASSRAATAISLLAAILAKLGLLRLFLAIGYDKAALVLSAKNFLHGQGISIGKSPLTDVSQKYYEWFIGWPPGYCLTISPFLYFLENNYMLACYLVDVLATVLFFIYLWRTLLFLQFPPWLRNAFLLFQGFFIESYIESSHPTDFLGLALFLAALFHCSRLCISVRPRWGDVFACLFFFYYAALVRYQYISIAIALPILLAFVGVIQHRKTWIVQGLVQAVLLGAGVVALFLFQQAKAGHMMMYVAGERGFFPENLQYMSPFILSAFFNLNFVVLQLAILFRSSYPHLYTAADWIGLPFALFFVILYIRFFFRKLRALSTPRDVFFFFFGAAAMITIGLLLYLSLTISSDIGPPYKLWTYVMDNRYFAVPILLTQVAACWWLFGETTRRLRILKAMIVVVAMAEVLHSMYFLVKGYSHPLLSFRETIKKTPEVEFACNYILTQSKKEPGTPVVVVSPEVQIEYFADWYGANPVFVHLKMNSVRLNTSRKVNILVGVDSKTSALLGPLIQEAHAKPVGTAGNYYFYSYEHAP